MGCRSGVELLQDVLNLIEKLLRDWRLEVAGHF
jgi:hypothetical protein